MDGPSLIRFCQLVIARGLALVYRIAIPEYRLAFLPAWQRGFASNVVRRASKISRKLISSNLDSLIALKTAFFLEKLAHRKGRERNSSLLRPGW